MRSTDIVAYTYQADIYCPGCIAWMFTEPDTGDGVNAVQAQWMSTEDILERVAERRGIDYSDPYSYDTDYFPKVVLADQANDADFDHCGNMHDDKFKDVCDGHIAHDEKDCRRWRNVEVRGPDFEGRDITWTDLDGYGFTLTMSQVFSDVPSERASAPNRIRWSYTFHDEQWSRAADSDGIVVFQGADFESTVYADEPAVVADLLGFLSLNDGDTDDDTDDDYFDHYTERQLAWRDERAETLSLTAFDQFEGE